jgi:nicotinate-nucleotide adenylyltransferase
MGYPPADLERYGDRILPFELSSPPISSSEVRDRVARGEPIDDLVPPAVADAIRDLGLYRGYTDRDSD